jgi:tRNA A37 methylthiotransferase MiaB
LSIKFQQQFIGETSEILLENDGGQIYGRSERYFMVYLEKTHKKLKKNDLIRAKLVRYGEHGMCGNVL